LLIGQAPCGTSDDIREKGLVRHNVVDLAQFAIVVRDDLISLHRFADFFEECAVKRFGRVAGDLNSQS
jgi:hypothetical protein